MKTVAEWSSEIVSALSISDEYAHVVEDYVIAIRLEAWRAARDVAVEQCRYLAEKNATRARAMRADFSVSDRLFDDAATCDVCADTIAVLPEPGAKS